MLQLLQGKHGRSTKDVDLLGRSNNSIENIVAIICECLTLPVVADGIEFDADSIRSEKITKDAEYQGVRLSINWRMGQIKQTLKLDIGFGDVIVPHPIWIDYPEILNFGRPRRLGYSTESVIAEKFHAMVDLDIANSRMKDFYDIWQLSQTQSFDGAILSQAIRATFERRETPIPKELPIALSEEFANRKQQQWNSFLNQLSTEKLELVEVIAVLRDFLRPVCSALADEKIFNQNWPARGHWQ